MDMKNRLVFLLLLGSLVAVAYGQNEFEKKVYVSASGDSLNYRLLRPEVEQEGEKYPLVLFLHGAGERGSDNEKQLFHGSQMWLNPVNRENYPAFVLFPQCPESGYWAYTERPKRRHTLSFQTHSARKLQPSDSQTRLKIPICFSYPFVINDY